MLTTVTIKGFKCFKNVRLSSLRRFNFIVGDSASGKTALLEAIFLAGGKGPEILFRLRRWRGLGDTVDLSTDTQANYDALFRDIFYDFDIGAGLTIELEDTDLDKRRLSVHRKHGGETRLPLSETIMQQITFSPIVFEWNTPTGRSESEIRFEDGKLTLKTIDDHYPVHFFTHQAYSSRNAASRFSQLSRAHEEDKIRESFMRLFPQVTGLSVEYESGEAEVYASVRGLRHKLAVSRLSFGAAKFLGLAVTIATNKHGLILIDEMENGLYFRNIKPLMGAIFELCEHYNTQIIASTHSYEFLQSIEPLMDKRERDFLLVKTVCRDGIGALKSLKGDQYAAILEQRLEIR